MMQFMLTILVCWHCFDNNNTSNITIKGNTKLIWQKGTKNLRKERGVITVKQEQGSEQTNKQYKQPNKKQTNKELNKTTRYSYREAGARIGALQSCTDAASQCCVETLDS